MIVAAVLAAGAGLRLGMPKALARIGERSLVEIVTSTCLASLVDETLVIVGAESAEVSRIVEGLRAREPDAALRCLVHERWQDGRTSTIQRAWSACPPTANLLVFPVDHPAVRLVTLDVLLGVFGYAAGEPDVVVPVVIGAGIADGIADGIGDGSGRRRRGHPVLLSHRLRDEVLALAPDRPLHDVVHARNASGVLEVPVDDEGILINVDDAAGLEAAAVLLRSRG